MLQAPASAMMPWSSLRQLSSRKRACSSKPRPWGASICVWSMEMSHGSSRRGIAEPEPACKLPKRARGFNYPTVTHLGDASHWLFLLVHLDVQASAARFIWRKRTAIGFDDPSSVVGSRQRGSDDDGTSPLRLARVRSVCRRLLGRGVDTSRRKTRRAKPRFLVFHSTVGGFDHKAF
ncbi:hypothetical protein B0I37DRAFT_30363 [Chaetomium sp. MPI-CAGE-AT-0009]|nr:hypothetical protein B0I37DRAFT_30363 [Chaetomium sp. MPI-CAGE-AT-0009]